MKTKLFKKLSFSRSSWSRPQLALFALLFGLVGGYILLRTFASPNPNLPGDLNGDNTVAITDLSILLSNYNTTNPTADINLDGTVNILDLSILLTHYGQSYTAGGGPTCTKVILTNDNLQTIINASKAGDTICLPAGSTYSYSNALSFQGPTGTATSPITFTSQSWSQPATINARITTFPGSNYITLSHLKLVDPGDPTMQNSNGGIVIGSDYFTLSHNDIQSPLSICVNQITSPTYGTAHYTTIDANRIHNCGLSMTNSVYFNHLHAIYDTAYNTTITNNYIYNARDRGIQLRGSFNGIARNNVIDNNGEGVLFGDLSTSNDNVYNNIISNSNIRYNIESFWGSTAVGTGNTAHDNCVWTTRTTYNSNGGIDSAIAGVTLTNNKAADPLYNNVANLDYSLKSGSPCSTYGVPSGIIPGP